MYITFLLRICSATPATSTPPSPPSHTPTPPWGRVCACRGLREGGGRGGGALCDVALTVLELMELPKPEAK
ncbi:hypothetical protein B0H13DRAFT_589310 [Mycena leptocephala]|nr:hypothetical protein B0H13DRAFT_589310 [Mycena leptocephala]